MAGLGIDVAGQLKAEIGGKLDRIAGALDSQVAQDYSVSLPLSGSIVAPGSETDGTVIGGPEGGKEWHVRRISFGPAQIGGTISAAGTIVVGKATGLTIGAQGSGKILATASSQFIEVARSPATGGTGGGAPGYFLFSHSQFVLRYPQNLAVIWISGNGTILIDGEALERLANITYGDT